VAGQLGGLHEHLEVVFAIDDERHAICMCDTAAVAAFDEQTPSRAHFVHGCVSIDGTPGIYLKHDELSECRKAGSIRRVGVYRGR
jgi:hypothetical protein